VAKLAPSGQLAYGTYLRELTAGKNDGARGIAVDAAGSAYVTGYTSSRTFPTTAGAYRETCLTPVCGDETFISNGRGEVFVTKLTANGSGLLYSTLLGGYGGHISSGITVDRLTGVATVIGTTPSSNFPVVNAHQPVMGSGPLLRTDNSGAAWTSLNGPPGRVPRSLAVATNGVVYTTACYADPTSSSQRFCGVFRSLDAGVSWTQVLPDEASMLRLSSDPNNASVLYGTYAQSSTGRKSTDGGASWASTAAAPGAFTSAIIVRPGASNTLFAGGTGGQLFRSTDGGNSWLPIGSGLPATDLSFALAPSAPDVMYAWSFGSLHRSTDAGATWAPRVVPGTLTLSLRIDPNDGATLYAGTGDGLVKSTDGGATWHTTLSVVNGWIDAVAGTAPTTVYAHDEGSFSLGPEGQVFRSTDAGETWTVSRRLLTAARLAAVNPATPSQVYLANQQVNDGGFYLDGFVTSIAADGRSLVYSSFIGGEDHDFPTGVAVGSDGTVVVAGSTASTDIPLSSPLQPSNAGSSDAFVLKLRYPLPLVSVDTPGDGAALNRAFTITGFAIDRGSASDCGIDAVHVWAFPTGGAPMLIGAPAPTIARPDVGALFGPQFANCGFEVPVGGLTTGAYTFALYPHSTVTSTFGPPRVFSITFTRQLIIMLNPPAAGATTYRGAKLGGWALDLAAGSGTGIDAVHVWAYPDPGSGQAPVFLGAATLGIERPDVGAIFGSQFNNAGYGLFLPALPQGNYLFAAYPHSEITGLFEPPATAEAFIGQAVQTAVGTPADGATVAPGTDLNGWSIDLASESGPGIDAVHVWAFPVSGPPVFVGVANYGFARPDVGAIFGSQFTNSGFSLPLSGLAAGTYTLAIFSHSAVTGTFDGIVTRVVTIGGS
jgi:photosystem II stability/assembly factor-like uncharacterized protein